LDYIFLSSNHFVEASHFALEFQHQAHALTCRRLIHLFYRNYQSPFFAGGRFWPHDVPRRHHL